MTLLFILCGLFVAVVGAAAMECTGEALVDPAIHKCPASFARAIGLALILVALVLFYMAGAL